MPNAFAVTDSLKVIGHLLFFFDLMDPRLVSLALWSREGLSVRVRMAKGTSCQSKAFPRDFHPHHPVKVKQLLRCSLTHVQIIKTSKALKKSLWQQQVSTLDRQTLPVRCIGHDQPWPTRRFQNKTTSSPPGKRSQNGQCMVIMITTHGTGCQRDATTRETKSNQKITSSRSNAPTCFCEAPARTDASSRDKGLATQKGH